MEEADIWDYKSSNSVNNYGGEVEKWVLQKLVRTAIINNQFEALNLKFTDGQNNLREKNVEERIEEYGGMENEKKIFKKYHITYEDFVGLYEDYDRFESVFLYYFGVNGIYPVSDEEVDEYYASNNARGKSNLIPVIDENGNPLPDEQLEEAGKLAIKVENLAKASGDTDNFDSLIKEYNKDTGVDENPNGYVITKDYDTIPEYKTAAFSLKIGEVKTIKTSQGYYIIKKYDVLDSIVYNSYTRRQALFEMKSEDMENLCKEWEEESKITCNDSLIPKYDIRTISVSKP